LNAGEKKKERKKKGASSLVEQVTSPQKGICCVEMVQFLKRYEGSVVKIML
jgi:hypothetical protein